MYFRIKEIKCCLFIVTFLLNVIIYLRISYLVYGNNLSTGIFLINFLEYKYINILISIKLYHFIAKSIYRYIYVIFMLIIRYVIDFAKYKQLLLVLLPVSRLLV